MVQFLLDLSELFPLGLDLLPCGLHILLAGLDLLLETAGLGYHLLGLLLSILGLGHLQAEGTHGVLMHLEVGVQHLLCVQSIREALLEAVDLVLDEGNPLLGPLRPGPVRSQLVDGLVELGLQLLFGIDGLDQLGLDDGELLLNAGDVLLCLLGTGCELLLLHGR